jgi:hypothetical protein
MIMFKLNNRNKRVLMLGALSLALCGGAHADHNGAFFSVLSGKGEVPQRETRARGVAIFQVNEDQTEISYRLIVANIENVFAAHIHIAPVGVNGPVVAFLAEIPEPPGSRFDGVLAEGTITDADLIGPLAGMTIADLVAAMESSDAYVNVHTNDGIAPPNEGPGDFPGGEIRGQIQ